MGKKKASVKKSTTKKAAKKKVVKTKAKRRDFFKKSSAKEYKKKKKEEKLINRLEKIKRENAKKMGVLKDIEKEDQKRKVTRKNKMIESKNKIPGEDLFEIKTNFDRVLEEVILKGSVNAIELMDELKIEKEQFIEIYTILSDKKLLKLDYPVVGKLQIFSLTYEDELKKEKEEIKEEKKKLKKEKKRGERK